MVWCIHMLARWIYVCDKPRQDIAQPEQYKSPGEGPLWASRGRSCFLHEAPSRGEQNRSRQDKSRTYIRSTFRKETHSTLQPTRADSFFYNQLAVHRISISEMISDPLNRRQFRSRNWPLGSDQQAECRLQFYTCAFDKFQAIWFNILQLNREPFSCGSKHTQMK